MAWRSRFLAARPSQDGHVVAEKWLSEELSGAPETLVDFHTAANTTVICGFFSTMTFFNAFIAASISLYSRK